MNETSLFERFSAAFCTSEAQKSHLLSSGEKTVDDFNQTNQILLASKPNPDDPNYWVAQPIRGAGIRTVAIRPDNIPGIITPLIPEYRVLFKRTLKPSDRELLRAIAPELCYDVRTTSSGGRFRLIK